VNLEVLVEEPSAARALRVLLPKIIPDTPFEIRTLYGKDQLLKELPGRLRSYAGWVGQAQTKIVVVVDRDDDDCVELKSRLERLAIDAGLTTCSRSSGPATVLNRIVIEELEAWFLGDVEALRGAYPRVQASLGQQARYRDPDAITGGTSEALHRVLRKHGYFVKGFNKLQVAGKVALHMDVESNRSRSFQVFRDGLRRLVSEGSHAQED
jgi:Domain of unknown function (DUF4276)